MSQSSFKRSISGATLEGLIKAALASVSLTAAQSSTGGYTLRIHYNWFSTHIEYFTFVIVWRPSTGTSSDHSDEKFVTLGKSTFELLLTFVQQTYDRPGYAVKPSLRGRSTTGQLSTSIRKLGLQQLSPTGRIHCLETVTVVLEVLSYWHCQWRQITGHDETGTPELLDQIYKKLFLLQQRLSSSCARSRLSYHSVVTSERDPLTGTNLLPYFLGECAFSRILTRTSSLLHQLPIRRSSKRSDLVEDCHVPALHFVNPCPQVTDVAFLSASSALGESHPPAKQSSHTFPWLFQHRSYLEWIEGTNSSGIFWICGKGGSGKSTLLKHLVESMLESSSLPRAATLFTFLPHFRTDHPKPFIGLVRSLLSQLLEQQQSDTSPKLDRKLGSCNEDHIFVDYLYDMVDIVSRSKPVYCFIDGLDELSVADSEAVVNIMRLLVRRPGDHEFKACLATRSPSYTLEGDPKIVLDYENGADISNFLEYELPNALAHKQFERNALNSVCQHISVTAQGNFLWVHFVVAWILDAAEAGEDIFTSVYRIPRDVDSLIAILLQRILRSVQDDNLFVIQALEWLCLALRPVSVLEVCEAMLYRSMVAGVLNRTSLQTARKVMYEQRWDEIRNRLERYSLGLLKFYEPEDILVQSGGPADHCFYLQLRTSQAAQMVHHTVANFLRGDREEVHETGHAWNLAQLETADLCLRYLESCSKILEAAESSLTDIRDTMPLFNYASRCWDEHLRCAVPPTLGSTRLRFKLPHLSQSYLYSWESLKPQLPPWMPDWLIKSPPMLCVYAYLGHEDIARCIYDTGSWQLVSTHQATFDGQTPLHLACDSGHFPFTKWLLDFGQDVEIVERKFGQSPLQLAARGGRSKIVQLLLQYGSEVDRAVNGTPALLQACSLGHYDTVIHLLDHGADLKMTDMRRGQTPLSMAAAGRHLEVVQLLLRNGADVNQADRYTRLTPLHHAVTSRSPRIVDTLLRAGARIEQETTVFEPRPGLQWRNRIWIMITSGTAMQDGDGPQCCANYNENSHHPPYVPTKRSIQTVTSKIGSAKRPYQLSKDDDEPDEQQAPPKRLKDGPEFNQHDPIRWACPFVKKFPGQFGAPCTTRASASIPALKQHLFKYHRNPQCERCGTGRFTASGDDYDNQLEEHCMSLACVPAQHFDKDYSQGFYRESGKRIKKRLRNTDYSKKWQAIYRIIFELPNDAETPSPYFEPATDEACLRIENHLLRLLVERLAPGENPDALLRDVARESAVHYQGNTDEFPNVDAAQQGTMLACPRILRDRYEPLPFGPDEPVREGLAQQIALNEFDEMLSESFRDSAYAQDLISDGDPNYGYGRNASSFANSTDGEPAVMLYQAADDDPHATTGVISGKFLPKETDQDKTERSTQWQIGGSAS